MRKAILLLVLFILIILPVSSVSFSQAQAAASSTYRGDINEDGQVNIFDLLEMLKMLADPEGQLERTRQIADIDESGAVNIFDLLGLLKVLSGAEEPGEIFWITANQGIDMVSIPSGSFQMGTNDTDDDHFEHSRPVHTVTLDGFQMSQTEITQAQYNAVMGNNPSYFTGDDSRPVEYVTWYDAVAFCNKLSEVAGLEPCYNLSNFECDFTKNGFRLPTEAAWEYACRAGTTTRFYTGDSESDLDRAAWYYTSEHTTHPVGQKEPNAWGLYDMHNNVYEWCNDWFSEYYTAESQVNPTGPDSGSGRVLRGGDWGGGGCYLCHSARRVGDAPNTSYYNIGFRVVRGSFVPGTPPQAQEITLVSIPGGTFQMGQIEVAIPVHTVTISAFQMSRCEITNAQYAAYLNAALTTGEITATSDSVTGATGDYSGQEYLDLDGSDCLIDCSGGIFVVHSGYENRPVVEVTWYGAKAFALRYGFDLPREAEWEYACRGGKQYEYGTDDGTISSAKVNYGGNVYHTTDVGSYPANPFGLYDMSGNVWEWCNDWYESYSSESQTNPTGPESGSKRVIRGGSWGTRASSCFSANRHPYGVGPLTSGNGLGFRVVRR